MTLTQEFQNVAGTLADGAPGVPIANGALRGDQLTFNVGDAKYSATVAGDAMTGQIVLAGASTPFVARRIK